MKEKTQSLVKMAVAAKSSWNYANPIIFPTHSDELNSIDTFNLSHNTIKEIQLNGNSVMVNVSVNFIVGSG